MKDQLKAVPLPEFSEEQLANPEIKQIVDICIVWLKENVSLEQPTSQKFLQEKQHNLAFYHDSLGRCLRNDILWSLCEEGEAEIHDIHVDDFSYFAIVKFWKDNQHLVDLDVPVDTYSTEYQIAMDNLMNSLTKG